MEQLSKKLETLLAINLVCLVLFFIFKEKSILVISFVLSIICLLFSGVLSIVHKVWSAVFGFLGSVNSKIILTLIFCIFLIPLSLLRKVFSKKRTQIKAAGSRYQLRNYSFSAKDFNKMG